MFKKTLLLLTLFETFLFSKEIIINLQKQILTAKEGDTVYMNTKISSGMLGEYETPTGTFYIFQKKRKHKSTLYPSHIAGSNQRGGADMPYMLKFKETGEAIHAGYLPGYPDSHGCVRLSTYSASKLFSWAKVGTKVTIVGETTHSSKRISRGRRVVGSQENLEAIDKWNASDQLYSNTGISSKVFYDKAMTLDY